MTMGGEGFEALMALPLRNDFFICAASLNIDRLTL